MTNNATNDTRFLQRFLALAFMLLCLGSTLKAQPFFKSSVRYDYNDDAFGGNPPGISIDMDGDGDLDIVGIEANRISSSDIVVAINNGDGVFNSNLNRAALTRLRDFTIGDLNNDGLPDILVAPDRTPYQFVVVINTSSGGVMALGPAITYTEGETNQFLNGVSVADLNNDGNLDIVLTKDNGVRDLSIFLGDGSGANWSANQHINLSSVGPTGGLELSVIADFDGDGILDIIASQEGGNTLFFFKGNSSEGNPTGTFQAEVTFPAAHVVSHMGIGDFNEDGLMDLMTNRRFAGQHRIMINNNDNNGASFVTTTHSSGSLKAAGVTFVDIDNDGHLDLLNAGGSSSATAFVSLGNGDGTFQSVVGHGYSEISPNGDGVTAGDYNGDGLIDIAAMGSDLHVFFNNTKANLSVDQGGVQLIAGDTYDVGFVTTGGNSGPVTFTITNSGDLEGIISGAPKIVVSGPDASMFTVDESSTSSTIVSGGTTTFTVTFTPLSDGNKMAALTILSNDLASPYVLNLIGRSPNAIDGIDVADAIICNGIQTTLTQLNGILDVGEEWVWYSGSCGGTPVGTGASIMISPGVTTTYFVRSENAGTPTSACVSGQVIVDANMAASITSEPAPLIVKVTEETQVLMVNTTGTMLTYQWYKNEVAITDGGRVSGSQTNTLTITSLVESDKAIYTCSVVNSCSQASTGDISLIVSAPPPNTVCGNTLEFDGNDEYINFGNVINPTNAITLEAWIRTDGFGDARQDIINKSAPGGTDPFYQYHLDIRPTGQVNFALTLDDTYTFLRSNTTLQPNKWYHLAATYDGTNIRIYIDGVEAETLTASGSIATFSEPLKIGEGFNNGEGNFNGQMDEIRIWDIARSSSEIQSAASMELQGNETGLVGYWNFNEGKLSAHVLDQTANNNNGILTNMDPLTDWLQLDGSIGGNSSSVEIVEVYSETSYGWNGNTYTTEGTYTVTFPNAAGCDSLAFLNLTFPPSPPNTVCGNTLDFNGADDYVHMGDAINSPSDAITLEAWIRIDDFGDARQDIINKSATGGTDPFYQYHLDIRSTGQVNFALTLDGTHTFLRSTATIQPNMWYHIAATYDGSNMRIYIDGVEVETLTASGSIATFSEPLKIGEGFNSGEGNFNGQIDEVRIWDVARTSAEISTFKEAELQGNELGLQGYWNFDEGIGSTNLLDQTSNGYHGILTNMDPSTDWLQVDGSVGGSTSSIEEVDLLFGETSYDWNGNTYTDDGIYISALLNSAGCDSLAFLNLDFKSVPPNTACGTVLEFDGTDDYISLGNVGNNPTSAITLEAWVFTNGFGETRQDIINKSAPEGTDPFYQYHLDIRPNGQINFSLTLDNIYNFVQTNTAIVADRWWHIAATYNGSNMRIYIDGVEEATKSASGSITVFSEPLQIGTSHVTNVEFDGRIDDVRIWESARTQAEILAAMEVELQGIETGLVGYWNFNQGIGSVLLSDQTSNGYDGTLTNMDALTDWVQIDGSLGGGNTSSEQHLTLVSETSYDWNGNTYTSDGTYNTTLLNAAGCDSLLTLNLVFIVGPPNTSCGTVLNFDGSDHHVNMGDVAEPTAEITLEAWIKTDAVGVRQDIIDKPFTEAVEPFYQYHLDLRPNGSINFSLGLAGGRVSLTTDPVISSNQWYHVAATYDGTNMRIYLDGVEEVSTSASGSIQNFSEPLKIGESFNGPAGPRPFDGQIDEVRIWEIARTQIELVNNKDMLLLVNETNLVGYWNFDQGSGSEILNDQTVNEYHGVLTDMNVLTDWVQLDGSIGGNSITNLVVEQLGGDYTSPSGNFIWTESGMYTEVIPSTMGCDSTITVDLTITRLDQVITFEALDDKSYGDADFTLSAIADSGLPVTFSSTDPSVATVSGNMVTVVGVGTTTISVSQAGSADYNPAISVDQTMTVLAKALTITADANQNKVYGQIEPVLTYVLTMGSLESEDELVGILSRPNGEDVGSYAIEQGTLTAGANYNITFVSDNFQITPKSLSVTADNKSRTYGDVNPAFTVTYSGFVNGEDETVLDNVPTVATIATVADNAGTYPIMISVGIDNNYEVAVGENGTLTINRRSITGLIGSLTRNYGDPISFDGITYDFSGADLVNGDTEDVLTGHFPDLFLIDVTSASPVGSHGIQPLAGTGNTALNYSMFVYSPILNYHIVPAPLTATADNQTKSQGDPNPALTVSYDGFVNGEDASILTTAPVLSTTAVTSSAAGEYPIVFDVNAAADNYVITHIDGTTTVVADEPLTITAHAQSKIYGGADPSFTYQLTSGTLMPGDMITGELTRVAGEDAGTYAIEMGTLTAGSGYVVSFVSNDLTILPKVLAITAYDNQSKTYGEIDPVYFYMQTGTLENGDVLTGELARVAGEDAGAYAISQGSLTVGSNYTITYQAADFIITPAPLSATANDQSRLFGSANPSLTIAYSGFVNGDDSASITEPTIATTANASSNVGMYPITLSGGSTLNYTLTLTDGTLTINQANQTITFDALGDKTQGDADFNLTASASSGLMISYSSSNTSVATVSGNTVTVLGDGTTIITASQAGDGNHTLATPVDQVLTIDELYIWNGSAWNNGSAPSSVDNALIDGNYIFSTNGSFQPNHLTIQTGVLLTVDGENTLTVNGDLNNAGNVHVTSGSSLITLGNATGTGYQIDRVTTFDTNTGRYSIVGSPIQSAVFNILGSNALVYGYDQSELFNASGNAGLDRFKTPAQLSQTTMNVGEGYFSAFTGDANGLVSFTGTVNTGTIHVPLAYTNQGIGAETVFQGFNLVSNPYPSAIAFTQLMSENSGADISGAIYLWDDSNSNSTRGSNADYVIVNALGSTDSQSNGLSKWDGFIRSGQGFFVQADSETSLVFNNSMRMATNNDDGGFYRQSAIDKVIKLNISDQQTQKTTLIGFVEEATIGTDHSYDAASLSSSDFQLYSLEVASDHKLGIQGLPFDYQDQIKLGFSAAVGDYTLSIENVESLIDMEVVLLKDHLTNRVVNLKEESYAFTTSGGEDLNRFTLEVSSSILNSINQLKEKTFYAYSTKGQLNVVFQTVGFETADFKLIDLTGQTVFEQSAAVKSNRWNVDTSRFPEGVYLLVIKNDFGIWKRKVITK